jgi:hypothetical protein
VCIQEVMEVIQIQGKGPLLDIHKICHTSLVPAHTISSGAAIVCSIPGMHFVGCHFKTCVTDLWMFLLIENDVLSMPF